MFERRGGGSGCRSPFWRFRPFVSRRVCWISCTTARRWPTSWSTSTPPRVCAWADRSTTSRRQSGCPTGRCSVSPVLCRSCWPLRDVSSAIGLHGLVPAEPGAAGPDRVSVGVPSVAAVQTSLRGAGLFDRHRHPELRSGLGEPDPRADGCGDPDRSGGRVAAGAGTQGRVARRRAPGAGDDAQAIPGPAGDLPAGAAAMAHPGRVWRGIPRAHRTFGAGGRLDDTLAVRHRDPGGADGCRAVAGEPIFRWFVEPFGHPSGPDRLVHYDSIPNLDEAYALRS